MADRIDNQEWQKAAQEAEEWQITNALARVAVGLGGKREAEILAGALGDRFTEKRSGA